MQEHENDRTAPHKAVVQPLLHSKRDTATLLSLSVRTIDNLITRKQLPVIRIGGRVMIRAYDIRKFLSQDHTGPYVC
jgi:excisionase family DNA binding protein